MVSGYHYEAHTFKGRGTIFIKYFVNISIQNYSLTLHIFCTKGLLTYMNTFTPSLEHTQTRTLYFFVKKREFTYIGSVQDKAKTAVDYLTPVRNKLYTFTCLHICMYMYL